LRWIPAFAGLSEGRCGRSAPGFSLRSIRATSCCVVENRTHTARICRN
jgi:hypothetical protein